MALHEEGIPAGIDALGTRAWALELLGERDKALALFAYAASLGNETGSRSAMLWVLCELGRIRLLAEDLDGARAAYNRALDVASGLRPCATIRVACAGLAEVETKLGHELVAEQWKARAAEELADFERWRRDTRWQLERFLGTN
jgi:tetratricopeptide (TPR) repeat protein